MLTQHALEQGHEHDHDPAGTKPAQEVDYVGKLLAIAPSKLTILAAAELLLAAPVNQQIQIVTILHALKGNQFLVSVLQALTPEQLGALDTGKLGIDATAGYVPHSDAFDWQAPEIKYNAELNNLPYTDEATTPAPQTTTEPSQGELTEVPVPGATAQDTAGTTQTVRDVREAHNLTTLQATNVQDRITGLERLQKTLPHDKSQIAQSGAITAELIDLKQDRNLADGDAKTRPWIGGHGDATIRKAIYPDAKPTDCTMYVDETFRTAMGALGLGGLASEILQYAHDTALKNKKGQTIYSGVDMQRAICAKLGWKSAYIDVGGDKAALAGKGTNRSFYRAPVASVVDSQDQFESKLPKLQDIPFAIITVNSGNHMKMLARGVVYECHWTTIGPALFEASALETESFSQTLLTAPAAFIDALNKP